MQNQIGLGMVQVHLIFPSLWPSRTGPIIPFMGVA